MAKTMELNVAIGVAAAGALTGLAKVSKSMTDLGNKYKKLAEQMNKNKAQQNEIKKMEQLTKAYSSAGKEWIAAVTKLRKLKEAYDKNGKSNSKLANEIKKQEKALEKLTTKKMQAERAYRQFKSAIDSEYGSLKKYREMVEKTTKSIEKQQKLKKIDENYKRRNDSLDRFSKYGDQATKVSAVTGAMTIVPLKIYMDVEESQADLRKMLGDEAQKYYEALREISDKSPLSQPEVFEIAGSLAQSGIKGDEIVEYTKMANKLKIAFDITTQESGEFLAKTKEQLGLTKEQVFNFADTINYMADNTASSAAQLIEFSQRVGSVAKTANLSKEANIAFGATLISAGTEANVAATGIKQLYLELGKGADTKKKANALNFLGINGNTLAQDMARDAEGTILKVLDRIKNANAGDKIGLLNDIFGEQAANSIATLANDTDKLRENLEKAKSEMANGAVEKEYASRMSTLSNQLKTVRNKGMNALADLGLALAPSIKKLMEQVTPLIEKLAKWIKQNPKLTTSIMKTIGIIALFSAGIATAIKVGIPLFKFFNFLDMGFSKINVIFSIGSKIGNIFKLLSKGVLGIIKVIKLIGVAIKAAFVANPIGVIVVAVVAVIAILVVLYNKNKAFRDFINKMWKQITKWSIAAWNWIKRTAIATFNYLKPFINIWVNNVIAYFNFLRTIVKGIFKMLSIYFKMAVGVWKGIFKLFIAFFSAKWNEIPGIVKGIWESVKTGMSGFVEGAKQILKGLFDWFGEKWNTIKDAGGKILEWGKSKLGLDGNKTAQNWSGTNYWSGGLTTVAERGAELVKIPGQNPFLAQAEMLLNLPKGTQILNNSQTRNSLRDRVSTLKERVSNFNNRNTNTAIGGDTIHFHINGGNSAEVERVVKKVLEERDNKRRRVAIG